MDHFNYQNNRLFAEGVDVTKIAAAHGTPCFVYSRATMERHWRAFDQAFSDIDHMICYAVKANANLAVLNVMARLGSGFDIVSGGELERVLQAGGQPDKIVFSGVGKKADEIRRALEVGIYCFNVESEGELERINRIAGELGQRAHISIRVNPDIDAGTHPYISTGLKENKFGIDIARAPDVYAQAAAMAHLDIHGIDCHIGSQLTETAPFIEALQKVLSLADQLSTQGIHISHLDMGGGLGIRYADEQPPLPGDLAGALRKTLAGQRYKLLVEPGRAIVGNAGILLTQVEYLKCSDHKNFAIVDAAMNDLLRPSLYSAWQEIIPVTPRTTGQPRRIYDVVGPVCETGDFLGKERELAINAGDLLAVRSAGAYGFSMSSNYNTRPRAAEVMVDGEQATLVREREKIAELFSGERILKN